MQIGAIHQVNFKAGYTPATEDEDLMRALDVAKATSRAYAFEDEEDRYDGPSARDVHDSEFCEGCEDCEPEIDEDDDNQPTSSKEASNSNKKTNKKGFFKSVASVGLACLFTFAVGKGITKKAQEIFPSVGKKLSEGVGTAVTKLNEHSAALSEKLAEKEGGAAGVAAKAVKTVQEGCVKLVNKTLPEGQRLGNVGGMLAMGAVIPKVLTADGNKNDLPDIYEEGQNAYKSALEQMNCIGGIFSAIS